MKLRLYQQESIEKIHQAWQKYNSVMFQMPTGTGKTVIFNEIAHGERQQDNHVLIIAHRQEIVEQIVERLETSFHKPVGIIMSQSDKNPRALIQVASIQTLSRRNYPYSYASKVIIDEAHHATAETYKKLWEEYPNAKFLGVTATPIRLSGEGFTNLFDILITSPSIATFIKHEYLAPIKYLGHPNDQKLLLSINKYFNFGGKPSQAFYLKSLHNVCLHIQGLNINLIREKGYTIISRLGKIIKLYEKTNDGITFVRISWELIDYSLLSKIKYDRQIAYLLINKVNNFISEEIKNSINLVVQSQLIENSKNELNTKIKKFKFSQKEDRKFINEERANLPNRQKIKSKINQLKKNINNLRQEEKILEDKKIKDKIRKKIEKKKRKINQLLIELKSVEER